MMNKEKIIKVAKRYCKETDCTQEETSLITEGFIEGVHWAQEEFKKSLWHDASEEPEKNKLIIEKIFEEDGYDYELDCPTYSCRTWVEMVKIFDIIKWCYLDDILPQKSMKATELKKKKNMVNIKDLKVGDKVTVHLCEGDFVDEVVCVKPQIPGANKYIVELKECGIIFNEDFLDFV